MTTISLTNFLFIDLAGNQHYALGQLDEAFEHYAKAIYYDKEQGQYYFNQGLVESRRDNTVDAQGNPRDNVQKAIDLYKKALELLSEQEYKYQAYFNKGICLRR